MNLNKKNTTKILLIITFAILLFTASQNISNIIDIFSWFMGIISPFIIGFCIAFVLNVIMRFFEEKVFAFLTKRNFKIWNKIRRPLCILLSFLMIWGILIILLLLIIPEIKNSALLLIGNLEVYMENLKQFTVNIAGQLHMSTEPIENLNINWELIEKDLMDWVKNESPTIISTTLDITGTLFTSIFNFVLSLVFAIYLLSGKERLIAQFTRIFYTLLPEKKVDKIFHIAKLSNKTFSKFLMGQCTEAVILGVLCYIGMLIFSMPYALMISSLMAVTALIPMFGAFIGLIFGALLIFLINPTQALIFVIFIICLQQFEGNVIYPKVVGKSIGLSGIWVLTAVTIGGNVYGPVGMLIAVPLCSVLYCMLREYVNEKALKKDTPPKKKVTITKKV